MHFEVGNSKSSIKTVVQPTSVRCNQVPLHLVSEATHFITNRGQELSCLPTLPTNHDNNIVQWEVYLLGFYDAMKSAGNITSGENKKHLGSAFTCIFDPEDFLLYSIVEVLVGSVMDTGAYSLLVFEYATVLTRLVKCER